MLFNFIFIFCLLIVSAIYPPTVPLAIIALMLYDWYKTKETLLPSHSYDKKEQAANGIQRFQNELGLKEFLLVKKNYLITTDWQAKRHKRFHIAKGLCESCGLPIESEYHAHHIKNYLSIPNDTVDDIRVLHPECHQKQHVLWGYPETLQDYKDWDAPIVKLD